jgi:aromatic ring hydroxylase
MSSFKIQQVTDQDILCGRGRGLESFPGNKLFRQVIKEHAATYIAPNTTRSERSRMVRLISDRLASEGMRFIKRVNKEGWSPLEDYDAKLKVRSSEFANS